MGAGARGSALALAGVVLAVAGCGENSSAGPKPVTGKAAAPSLATQPAGEGEIVVRGEAGPEDHGPYAFEGRYRVRFEQRAPEDPRLDFTQQTPFTAVLVRRGTTGPDGSTLKLFEQARRSGQKTLMIRGRWTVSVEYGDFPYALRFTPVRG